MVSYMFIQQYTTRKDIAARLKAGSEYELYSPKSHFPTLILYINNSKNLFPFSQNKKKKNIISSLKMAVGIK